MWFTLNYTESNIQCTYMYAHKYYKAFHVKSIFIANLQEETPITSPINNFVYVNSNDK